MSIKAVDLNYVYGNGTAFEQQLVNFVCEIFLPYF